MKFLDRNEEKRRLMRLLTGGTGALACIYGRAKEILPIRPLGYEWLKTAFPQTTPFTRLKMWGVWGGVQRYWELQEEESSLWDCVRRHVASPLGLLRNEPNYLLLDDMGDTAQSSAPDSSARTKAETLWT